jgi:hypothetical protein
VFFAASARDFAAWQSALSIAPAELIQMGDEL